MNEKTKAEAERDVLIRSIDHKVFGLTNGVSISKLKPFIEYYRNMRIKLWSFQIASLTMILLVILLSLGLALGFTTQVQVIANIQISLIIAFPISVCAGAILYRPNGVSNRYNKKIEKFVEEKNMKISKSTFDTVIDYLRIDWSDLNEVVQLKENIDKMAKLESLRR